MASTNQIYVSAGVYTTETDLTFASAQIGLTSLGIAGEFPKGPVSDTPVKITSYDEFVRCFGGLNPCTFNNSKQLKYEGNYIAKQFLSESNALYVSRVLGLSGYNAGTGWLITLGGNIDLSTVTPTGTTDFNAVVTYNDGECVDITFDDPILEQLFDRGALTCDDINAIDCEIGDTITVGKRFVGDCEKFFGGDVNMTMTGQTEPFLCITANTVTAQTVTAMTSTSDVQVMFGAGTVTVGATLGINIDCNTSLIDIKTSTIRMVTSGLVVFYGGTITHNDDGSIELVDGTIELPDGTTIIASHYKICDICGDVGYIACPTGKSGSIGTNFDCISGATTGMSTIIVTGETQMPIKIPSGIVEKHFTGTTTHCIAQPLADFNNIVVGVLRSKAEYRGSDEILNFDITQGNLGVQPLTNGGIIKPYDTFQIVGRDSDGNEFRHVTSFDNTKTDYINKVFADTSTCCENISSVYLEEFYPNMLKKLVDAQCVYCIKPSLTCCGSIWNYQTEYKGAKTPWIVSELRGNSVRRLFRFHTVGDGDASNREIKVSITNIKPDARQFDVEIRRFGDTDLRPVILQKYSRLTLDPNSNNFIGKRIGTIDNCYPDALGGCYVQVELADECLTDGYPAGFEGYPIRDYCDAISPDVCYKTCYDTFENPRRTKSYLGISDTVGFDPSLLSYKGIPDYGDEWSGTTKGFHMDKDAVSVALDGVRFTDVNGNSFNKTLEFETGCANFQSEAEMKDTHYEFLKARRFTVLPFGGFDGFDIHRERRTNTDEYMVRGTNAQNGVITGSFKTYGLDGDVVVNSDYYAYLRAIRTFANPEVSDINILTTPSINLQENNLLVSETIGMVEEERCDSLYLPTLLDCDENGDPLTSEDVCFFLDNLYDSSYAATYFPWGKLNDNENNRTVWLPPTAEVVKQMAYTDRISNPWFAAAGVNRGTTDFVKTRFNTTQQDRDNLSLCGVNPLATFRDYGVVLWGNKTLQQGDSALDRINVRRLLLQARKLISTAALRLLFDQNDDVIRSQFLNLVNPILENIRTQRGLLEFRVNLDTLDEGTDGNQLCGQIWIRPTEAVEVLCVGFNVTDSGTAFENI